VRQCAQTLPAEKDVKKYFIYKLKAAKAKKTAAEDTADWESSDEHWLTDDIIINSNGGKIPLEFCGWINVLRCRLALKIYDKRLQNGRFSKEPEATLFESRVAEDGPEWVWIGPQQN